MIGTKLWVTKGPTMLSIRIFVRVFDLEETRLSEAGEETKTTERTL